MCGRTPDSATVLDALGPRPVDILGMERLGFARMALGLLPFLARRYRQPPDGHGLQSAGN